MVLPPDVVRQLARLLLGRRAVLSKLLVELQGTTGKPGPGIFTQRRRGRRGAVSQNREPTPSQQWRSRE